MVCARHRRVREHRAVIDPDDPDYDELVSLAREDEALRRYRAQLAAHPDPRDPDYPGEEP